MSSPWPPITRAAQLSAAVAAFTRLRGTVLYGEAGVGKSLLASEIRATVDHENPDRFTWFSVTGSHLESTIPLSAIDGLLSAVEFASHHSPRRIAEIVHDHMLPRAETPDIAILVDDAHLLDASSAEVLAQLCRLGNVYLLCTIRSGRTQADALVGLWRDDLLARIDVPPFTPDEVGEAVWASLGGPVDSALVRELFRSSSGNPMYVRELVRAGRADGSIVQRHGIWIRDGQPKAAERIIDLVAAELGRLSKPERDAIELIALAEPVSSALIRPLIDGEVVDRLVSYGLVRVESVPGQGKLTDPALRLSHPIYSECVRNMISPPARHEWYATLYRETPPAPHHTLSGFLRWTAWTLECGLEIAATDLVRAARAASSLGQVDFALEAATAAFEHSVDTQTAVDALTIRSRELYYQDQPLDALRDVETALRLLRATPLTVDESVADAIFKIHELRADIQQFGLDDPASALETIDRFFLPLIGNGERVEQSRRYALAQMVSRSWAGDLITPLAFVDEPVDELNGELDAAPPVMVALTWAGRTTEAMALAAHYETVAIPDDPTSMRAGANLRFGAFVTHLVSGRLQNARACAPNPLSINELGHFDPAGTYACSARLLAAEGRWNEADEQFQVARRLSDVRDPFGLKAWTMASESLTAAQVGDDERARELILRVERTPWRASRSLEADIRCQITRTLLTLRDPAAAEVASTLAAWSAEHGYHFVELWALDLAALADPQLVRDNGTSERLAELKRRIDAPITDPLIAHIQAIINDDQTLEQAAAAQLGQLGHWVPRQATMPASLSRRESEVARLVAAGLSSAAIAERLHLSRRTVEAHTSRIYAKLGVNRRRQLAEALRKSTA